MNPWIRHLLCGLAFAASVNALAADPYPTRPIRIVVPFAPGGLIDTTSRYLAQKMSESLGQQVLVDNRPGADGTLGVRYVKSQPADGYTLLGVSSAFAQTVALKLDPGYEVNDFVGVGGMNEAPMLMVGASSQPDMTLAQILARAKAKPDSVSFASGGVGTGTWMAAALMINQVGAQLLHVPYKGAAAAMPDVVSGRVNFIFDTSNSPGPHVKEGRLRAFGVTSAKRMATFPNVPTLAEQGITNYHYTVYQGLLAPAGTPPEVVNRLAQALRAATMTEEFRQRCLQEGSEPIPLTAEEFIERVRREALRTAKLASDLGIAKQ